MKNKESKVHKSSKLNQSNFGDFTLNNYQVFLKLASRIKDLNKVDKKPEELQRKYLLTAKDFSEEFEVDLSYSYRILEKACKKLMKTSVILPVETLTSRKLREINVCSMAVYNEKEGSIEIEFTDRIMPHLAFVKEKFTCYNLKEIIHFRSIYSTRLYELIHDFKETGWVIKTIEELRDILAVNSKFKAYKDLKKYTFKHAVEEINKYYPRYNLRFEEIKTGRKVTGIKFLFNKISAHKVYSPITCDSRNNYIKHEKILSSKAKTTSRNSKYSDTVLEEQLSFKDKQKNQGQIGNAVNNILQNLQVD